MSDASSSSSPRRRPIGRGFRAEIGVIPATLMVAGNMMETGVFMLPANLAATGGIAIFGWLITVVGAVSLALVFAKLAAIDPAPPARMRMRASRSARTWATRPT